jgi:hypothetical protein
LNARRVSPKVAPSTTTKEFDMTMESAVMGRGRPAAAPNLRWVLGLDAATCLVMGVLLAAGAAPMASLLALPRELLFWAGIVLFPCAALMIGTAALPQTLPALVWVVILGNAAWVMASLGVLIALEPNALGIMFVLVQAAAVVGLLVLERRGVVAT